VSELNSPQPSGEREKSVLIKLNTEATMGTSFHILFNGRQQWHSNTEPFVTIKRRGEETKVSERERESGSAL
jgi:hypothetical protein